MNANMIYIEPKPFVMGSDKSIDELPLREVTLSPYYIDITPVTNEEFAKFIEANGYKNKSFWCDDGWEFIQTNKITRPCYWEDEKWNQKKYPVTGISWYEAKAYTSFAGKELPTEAQWEYAAKGDDNRLYPWGNEEATENLANFAPGCMASLDRKPNKAIDYEKNISPFGCLDMAGNFFEWCLDSASDNYSWDQICENPLYKDDSHIKIARGGSGLHDEDYMRCSARDSYMATISDNMFTLRCVINVKEKSKIASTPRIEKKPSSLLYYQEEPPKDFDVKNWKLAILYKTKRYELSYDDIMKLPQTTISRRMVCVCNWSIRRTWSGTYLKDLLKHLDIKPPKEMYLKQLSIGNKGKESYDSTMKLDHALENDAMIIHSVDGKPLPLEQGFPLRFYNFALLAYKSVKGLQSLEITDKYELGFWEKKAGYDIDGIIRKKKFYFVDLNTRQFITHEGEVKDF